MAAAAPSTGFDRDTAVAPLGGGRYRVAFDAGWWVARGPNGGYLAAILTQAIRAEVADDARALRSLTVHFLRVPEVGEGEATVRIERAGRGMSTVSARLEQDGAVVALALAALAGPYPPAVAYEHAEMPEVAPPEEIVVPADPVGSFAPRFREQFSIVPAIGPMAFSGSPGPAVSGAWMRLREPRPIDAAAVVALCDAWWPSPYVLVDRPLVAPTIDLTVHLRSALPLPYDDLLVEARSDVARDGYFEEDVRLFSRDGTLVAQSRQLALAL